jgi:hypothetical protein
VIGRTLTIREVMRVNWLRAKARHKRWEEEVLILTHEMIWTQKWFEHYQQKWEERMEGAKIAGKMGNHAYAAKQVYIWSKFGEHARKEFAKVGKPTTK